MNNILDIKTLVGMKKDDAFELAKKSSLKTRIKEEDGKEFMGTMDYDEGRINFCITGGMITKTNLG